MRTRVVFAFFCSAAWLAAAEPEQLYLDVVKPALEQQCLGCHGVGNTFGKLDLRTREAARVTDEFVHDKPWYAVGIAAAAGLVVGMLIGRR